MLAQTIRFRTAARWGKLAIAFIAFAVVLGFGMRLDPRIRIDSLMNSTQRVLGVEPVWEVPRAVLLTGPAPTFGPIRRLRCEGWSSSRRPDEPGVGTTSRPEPFPERYHGNADVHYDGRVYRMWFTSAQIPPAYSGERSSIRMATSHDGQVWKEDNDGRPVIEPGPEDAFDSAQVGGASVIFDGTEWKMWYTGLRGPDVFHRWEKRYRIGMATSPDGIHWAKSNDGHPVLSLGRDGEFDDTQVMFPSVIKEGAGYRTWYAASSAKIPHSIGMATSLDGIHWTKSDSPVEGLGFWVTGPSVTKVDDQYVMVYVREDLNTNTWHLAAAVSQDGFHWHPLNGGRSICGTGADTGSDEVPWTTDHPSRIVQRDGRLHFWVHIDEHKTNHAALAMATLTLEP